MVDFQSRDTRRSLGDDEDEEPPEDEEADEAAAPAESGAGPGDHADDRDHSEGHDHDHHEDHDHDHHEDHDHHAEDLDSVTVAVLTISSSRSMDEDTAGEAIVEALESEGHEIATRDLINDDFDGIQSAVDGLVGRGDVQAVVTTGGTGVAPEDVTPEAVRQLFEKELPGFGELFRARSRDEIGTKVLATRAIAGIADGVPVFCLPGSEAAARLGTAEVIEPVVGHLAGLSRPHDVEE